MKMKLKIKMANVLSKEVDISSEWILSLNFIEVVEKIDELFE
jgi:hypothetical protein